MQVNKHYVLYFRDFAYQTIKDRLPVILSRVADTVYRLRPEVEKTHGEVGGVLTHCGL